MRKLRMLAYGLAVLVGVWAIGATIVGAQVKSQDPRVALMDDCDPNTFPAGLCVVLPRPGDATFAEFRALLFSPMVPTVVGHPGWRFEPSHLDIGAGQTLRITNSGGENHTFTEVKAYGGGSIPLLNGVPAPGGITPFNPLVRAPECPLNPADLVVVAPGDTVQVTGLSPGVHKFECCIHPWMRATIDVE